MFVVEGSVRAANEADKLSLVDHERGVWLREVGSYAGSSVRSFQMGVGSRTFLLERLRGQKADGEYAASIVNLGFSAIGTMRTGKTSDRFVSDADRQAIGLIAAEALLVFGGFYTGNSDPKLNTETIELDGVEYTLSDLVDSPAEGLDANAS